MPLGYSEPMNRTRPFLLAGSLAALLSLAAPASAQRFAHGNEQNAARRAMLDGRVMPFSIIKRRIQSEMGDNMSYVGVAPPPRPGVYRMQFMRDDGVVIWVDVDGKTGNIIGRTR